ncbi:phthiocerol/phthiodiolone dimycocerosyl transferase family protein [Nocardia ninae]
MGTIDQCFVPSKKTVVYTATCVGEVDATLLRRAFELMCRRYPMLAGTIENADDECFPHIREHGFDSADVQVIHGRVADWLAHGASALDPALGLAKLEVVREGEITAVALHVSHVINDAHMGFALLDYFWRTVAVLGADTAVPKPAPLFPRRLEDLLAERGVAVPEPVLPDLNGLHSFAPTETLDESGLRLGERITLSCHHTDTLLRRARAQGTTVHALLSAAIIRAERVMIAELSGTPTESELPMIIGHAVDLRPHLQPPAQPSDATNGLGYAPTIISCGPDSDLLTLGKEAKAQIVHGIESGAALTTMFAAARIVESNGPRDSVVNTVTNWGVVPSLDSPHGMRIVDFRGFVTGASTPEISYIVYTFLGRLNVEFAFSERYHRPDRIIQLRQVVAANLNLLIPDSADEL